MRTSKYYLIGIALLALVFLTGPLARAFPIVTNVVETGGDNEATDTIVAKWTGVTWNTTIANEPTLSTPVGTPFAVPLFGNGAPTFVDRNHRYTNASGTVTIPYYLAGGEYIMAGNDNRDNNPGYRLDVSIAANADVYMLIDNRLQDGNNADPPTFISATATNMQWIVDEGWTPVRTGVNRTGDTTKPDEVGIDEGSNGDINNWYSVYTKKFAAGTFQLKQPDAGGRNMYGVVVVQALIVNVVETGGDAPDIQGNGFSDTGPAQWTGVTFTSHQANEPVPGLAAGAPYTVGVFGNGAPVMVDRNHRYTNASGTVLIPSYLAGNEYIMSGNDNRDNASYRLDVTISRPAFVYMLIDNRLQDGDGNTPPTFGSANMQWILDQNWTPIRTGINRTANASIPDELGIDESADGTINQWYSIYMKLFPAGTFTLLQPDNAGRNMYGVVVRPAAPPPPPTGLAGLNMDSKVQLFWTGATGVKYYVVKRATTSGGPYTPIGTNTVTKYTDTTVVNDTPYYYVVSAVGDGGESADSAPLALTPAAAPSSVVATGGTNQITLTWASFTDASTYRVYRSAVTGGPYTQIATNLATTTFTDTNLPNGTAYYYLVRADLTVGGQSGYSDEATGVTAPSTPANFDVSLFAAQAIRLTWTTTDPVVSSFRIEESADNATFTEIASTAGSARRYYAANLPFSTTRYYRIRAANAGGFSDYTAVGSATTPTFGLSVNFANTNFTTGATDYPIPGYLDDYGFVYADRGNGYSYGWDDDNTQHGRTRNASNSPEKRYDTFNHLQKTSPVPFGRSWSITLPNDFYKVQMVSGDPTAVDSTFQFWVEDMITPTAVPSATGNAYWVAFEAVVKVADGLLTVSNGPSAANNKLNFINIYSVIPVAPVFGLQPVSTNVLQSRPVTLSARITDGSLPIGYQLYRDGQIVPGAGGVAFSLPANLTYTLPIATLADAGTYTIVASNAAYTVTSADAVLTVDPDTVPPVLLSVGSLDGYTIAFRFDELLDTNEVGSIIASLDPFNYEVDDDGTLKGVVGQPVWGIDPATGGPDHRSVVVSLDPGQPPVEGSFTVKCYSIPDRAGNPGDSQANGVVVNLTPVDVGNFGAPGASGVTLTTNGVGLSFSNAAISVLADGADIWTVADGMHFAYRRVTGNFDAKVRVESLTRPDTWSKAGLLARFSTNANSRNIAMLTTPATGQNVYTFQWRDAGGLSSGNFSTTNTRPTYPDAWVRLQRIGSLFIGYVSSNNVDWVTYAARDTATNSGGPFPATLLVGLATTSHHTNTFTRVQAEYRDFYLPPPPTITTQPTPADQVVGIKTPVSYSVVASAPPDSGPLTYVWRKDGVAIPGATSATFSIASTAVADSGAYTVTVANDGGGVVSTPVTLTVTNQLPVVVADTVSTPQNTPLNIPVADLLANDSDPEGDPLSVVAVSGVAPVTFTANFNSGLPANTAVYGSAAVDSADGVNGSGSLKLTTAVGSLLGSYIINDLTPGNAVSAFTVRFKILVTGGSGNPADGFSLSFADDLPDGTIAGGEEGGGSKLIVAFDNYDNGGGEAPAVDVKWAGATIGHVLIPKIQSASYLDVFINLDPDGTLDVSLGGTARYTNFQTPYTPFLGGRFGLAARTGGEYETHYVDDLSISVINRTSQGGNVSLAGGVVTYRPPTNTCGSDSFYYSVSDGQVGGVASGTVTVVLTDVTPPTITTCPASVTIAANTSCQVAVPDLTIGVVATDTCSAVTVTQDPLAGTLVGLGNTVVTLSARDASNNVANCTATVTVVDQTPPVITACPPAVTLTPDATCQAAMPDLTAQVVATDNCGVVSTTQNPAAGTLLPIGVQTVTFTVKDAANNEATCTATANVRLHTVAVNSETICPGSSVILTATTDAANPVYLWSPGSETTASITVSPATTTTYTVTVTSDGCANSASGTVTVRGWDTFANTSPITINDNAAATPYPSTINVSGLTATVCRVTVTLSNVNHTFPSDIDVLLVGPNGAYTYLMSDAGGFDPLANVTITLDDTAAASLPENAQIVSGTYKPTNYGAKKDGLPDLFPAPAPVGPYKTNMVQFNGINPNGTWSLYVMDDQAEDFGVIAGGWSLAISTFTPFTDLGVTIADIPDPVARGSNLTYTVTAANLGLSLATNVVLVDTLPAGVTLGSVTSSQGSCTVAAGVITCALGNIAPSAAATLTIQVVPTALGSIVNSATLTTSTLEFVSANNSASATTTVEEAPAITGQPQNTLACVGGPASFTVVATGTAPLTYQWYLGANPVPEATGSTLNLTDVQAGNLGNYSVVVANAVGVAVSSSATLAFHSTPTITAQPQNTASPMGNTASFSVTATSTATAAYQWLYNGAPITGATAASLPLSNLTLSQSGNYQVVVANCGGSSVTSAVAILTVTPISGITFDFNTPRQYTNVYYNLPNADWVNSALAPVPFEVTTGGVANSGALDMVAGGTENTSVLMPLSYDFSLNGKTLFASMKVKVKAPSSNNRLLQMGFQTLNVKTQVNRGTQSSLTGIDGNAFMTVRINSTAQPALTYQLEQQTKPIAGTGTAQGNAPAAVTLTAGNWYRFFVAFTNIKATVANSYTVLGTIQDMGTDGQTPGAIISTLGPANVAQADIVNARALWFAFRSFENCGADYFDDVVVYTQDTPIAFVQQPASQTVLQGRTTTFQVMVDGKGPYAYQWFKNGQPIPGAGNWKYTTPPAPLSDNGALYTVTVTGPGPANSLTSDAATLTVQAEALSVVSVGSADGNIVGVRFNQPVQKAGAETAANYLVNGVAPFSAVLRPDGQTVVLTSPSRLTGAFTVTVQNVVDFAGGALGSANTANGVCANLASLDISQPTTVIEPAGSTYSFAPGAFEITAGGVDIWNTFDTFRFVYTLKTGDFDVKMRVPYMDVVRSPSKAGLMARYSLDPASPMVFASPNPPYPGRNYYEGSRRDFYNVSAVGWGNNTGASFPNTWLRFRRVGNTFYRYSGVNGVNWVLDGQTSTAFVLPDTVYFGLAVCSVANINPETAQIDNYGDFAGYPGAVIAITTQPVSNPTVAAGSTTNLTLTATVSGVTVPSGELAYVWQRTNTAAGGWTNLANAGGNNPTVTAGPFFIGDNGTQFRCVVTLLGAASVTSEVVTVTVTDTAAPTVAASSIPSLSVSNILLNFSELMGPSAINPANYYLTNSAGAHMGVASAAFLSGDLRTVVLTTTNMLAMDTYRLVINNVADLNGNAIAANTVRTMTQVGTPPAQQVVIEVYQDIANATTVSALTGHATYIAGTPTFITYSSVFGYNTGINNSQDNYGVKAYTYFVPPTNGNYKFWIRCDDALELWLNTNGTAPGGTTLSLVIPTSANSPAAEQALNAIDHNTATKYLNFDKLNTGFTVQPVKGPSVVKSIQFSTANDVPDRDPLTFTLEGSGSVNGPWTLIASGSTGLDTDPGRLTTVPAITFANSTSYAAYRVLFPTVRNATAANSMQISEVWLQDSSGNDVTAPLVAPGPILIAANTAANGNYSLGTTPANSITNIPLVGGRSYYMMALLKEGGGNDGFSVMWTDPAVTTAPGNGVFIPAANLAYPSSAAPSTPVVTEWYTVYPWSFGTMGMAGAGFAELDYWMANDPYFVQSVPNTVQGLGSAAVYQKGFATQPALGNTRFDNYIGRMYSYFVAPSNGLYRFWLASDDVSRLYMNTNAVNSTDPTGKSLLVQLGSWNASYTVQAQNVSLVGGQKYYLEVLWKEGGGGDGAKVAVRRQSDSAAPAAADFIPASMLAFPYGVDRVGVVGLTGISPVNPTVTDGQTVTFSAVGVSGAPPYSYLWLKNGQPVYFGTPFQSVPIYVTLPLSLSDNGAVFTLVVTNTYSRVERSTTVTVIPASPPLLLTTLGSQYGNLLTLTFSEVLDPITAEFAGNYVIPGLNILQAKLDASGRKVTLQTSPQVPSTLYTLTVSGVRERTLPGDVVNVTTNFTSFGFAGTGLLLVEMYTNIQGTTLLDLTNSTKFMGNVPDVYGYVTRFGYDSRSGQNATASLFNFPPIYGDGLNFYGIRVSAYFIPPSNGLYRFYIRSDDLSALYMNTNAVNSTDPAGKVKIASMEIACCKAYSDASGGPNNSALLVGNIALNGGQPYYMEGLMKEGGGGDVFTMAFREANDASVPADTEMAPGMFFSAAGSRELSQLVISQIPPATISLAENDPFSLSVVATARVPISYTWSRSIDGGLTYSDVPGQTAATFAGFAALADNGAIYRVTVAVPGYSTSFTTLFSVSQDTTPPFMVTAASLNGYTVGVRFNERVDGGFDPLSGYGYGALDPFNWSVEGGAIQVTNVVRGPDETTVVLQLDAATPIATPLFQVDAYALCDYASVTNCGDSSAIGELLYLTPADVGTPGTDPMVAGNTWTCTNSVFDVVAGGSDIWNTVDGMHYVYRPVTGNFDVKVRLNSLTRPDNWTKAGLMARPTVAGNSRNVCMVVTPSTGQNTHAFQWRDVDGGASASVYNTQNPTYPYTIPPVYPNAWVRLQRVGQVFNGYLSTNGTDWILFHTRDVSANTGGPYPDTILVGMAVTSHNNTGPALVAKAEFRNLFFPLPATIVTQPAPEIQVVGVKQTVTYNVVAAAPPNSGTITYLWKKDGVALPGQTTGTFTIASTAVADSGVYTVTVANDGGGVTSVPVTLIVSNALPVVVAETTNTTQNVALAIPVANLLANDSDPEGDPLSIIAVSGVAPVTFATDFNAGAPAGASIFGAAGGGVMDTVGGVNNSGCFKMTLNAASQAGSIILDELTPGKRVSAFTASFKLRIGDASAEPADGFSFNFANDLPIGATTPAAAENGGGTGFSFCVDNYRFATWPVGGTANTSGMKIRYNNVDIAGVQLPTWNQASYRTVTITVTAAGQVTVLVDGVNIFGNLTVPWVPGQGRFGLYARTGGQYQTHYLDDLSITVLTLETARGGQVALGSGGITYTPPLNGCGNDSFYYIVSDGQLGGQVADRVDVRINEATPEPPVITGCPNVTISTGVGCTAVLPDLTSGVVATDNCCCVTITQSPAAGTALALGAHTVTFTATDTMGLTATCPATVTVIDTTPPSVSCPSPVTLTADPRNSYQAAIPDLVTGLVAADDCPGALTASQVPTAGTLVPIGATNVVVTVADVAGNVATCTVPVTVQDVNAYAAAILAQGPIAYYRFNDGVSTPVIDTAVNRGSLGTAGNGFYNLAVHPVPGALAGSSDTAARTDGASKTMQVPYNAALNTPAPFSVEAWLKPARVNAAGTLTCALSSGHFASPRSGWLIYQSDTGWNLRFYNQNGTATSVNFTGGGAPNTNTWYHVVVAYDGTTASLYVNGVLAASANPTGYVPGPDGNLAIGMRSDNSFFWAGDADELAFYNTALSAARVTAHYENGTNAARSTPYDQVVLADAPVGYWPLNEPAFVPPVALNSGSLGAVANGGYYGGAIDGAQAPRGPQFVGFESGNTALQLDGVNDFVGTLIGLMNNRPVFTMSAWIRRSADQANRTGLWGQNDLVEFGYIDNATIQAWTDNALNVTPNPFPNGEWAHLALVSTGPTISIYTNGILAGSRAQSIGTSSAFNFNIGGGGIFDGAGNFFRGQIDELAIFDKALSPSSIGNQYATAMPTAPRIVGDLPATTVVYVGDTLRLPLTVIGTPPLRTRWFLFGGEVAGQTGTTLVISNMTDLESGAYSAEVSNAFGGPVASSSCEVIVSNAAPTIVQQPAPASVYAGYTARFSVVAVGGQNVTYQWKKGDTDIPGATSATLVITPVQPGDAADYKVVVTNPVGSTESTLATLTVVQPAGSYAQRAVGNSPIAYWPLNEAAGPVAYDYVGGHNGTAVGGATFAVAGPQPPTYPGFDGANTSVQFNGADASVTVAPSPVNAIPAFTLAGWINLAAAPAARTALWGQNDALEFGFHTADTIGIWSPTAGYVAVSHGMALDQWYFVVATGNGTTMAVYINGRRVASGGSAVANYGSSSYPFNIGAAVLDASGNYFNGRIDEVAVYNKALSADEICQMYAAAVGRNTRIEAVPGLMVLDSKPAGTPHDGLNRGASWLVNSTDSTSVTRDGVMQFAAAEGDQITLAANPAFNSPTGTIVFWMRSAGIAGAGNEGAILFDRRTSSGDVIVQLTSGAIFVQASDNGGANSFATTGTVSDNRWHHIAYVYDQGAAGSIAIYIDGVLDKAQNNTKAWSWPATQQIELGRSHDPYWFLYNGQMDDFRIYNRILTQAEIAQVMAGNVVSASELMVRFNFDTAPSGLTLFWPLPCSTLQQADQILSDGATIWTDVPGATSPYLIRTSEPMRFFRIKY